MLPDLVPGLVPDLLTAYDAGPGRLVRADFVTSADGAAVVAGSSRPLSTPADRAVFRVLRALSDVVLVGAGTARAESYGPVPLSRDLRDRRRERGLPETPALAVVSRSLDLPRALVEAAVVLTCAAAPHEGLPDAVVTGRDQVDLREALDRLADRGLAHVVCEGGPALLGDLVAAGLLDELCLTVSPALVGAAPGLLRAPLPVPVPLELVHVLAVEGTLLTRWRLDHPARGGGTGA